MTLEVFDCRFNAIAQGASVLARLCTGATWGEGPVWMKEDGSLLTVQEIIDHMSFLMMAAHDTITSSVTSMVYQLAKNPEWQEKLRAEMLSLGLPPGASLPYERLGDLDLVEMAFKEAMRIVPPVPSIPRRAVRDFTFKGFDIPGGTGVGINPLFTHHMASIWPNPA